MNTIVQLKIIQFLTIALLFSTIVHAADSPDSNVGFLSDYTNLKRSSFDPLTQYYITPSAHKKLATYKAILVEQPHIFIATESPYQGFKPAQMNAISEALRVAVIQRLSNDFTIATEPGDGVLYLRLALTDFSINKDRIHILGYTPVGLIFRGLRMAANSSFENAVQHLSLVSVKIEGEVSDSQSAEVLGQFIDSRPTSSDPETWEQLLQELLQFGVLVDCQLQNASKSRDMYQNCRSKASKELKSSPDID
jgi:hypothetical protein